MEYEKCVCPVVNVDGILATGKQFRSEEHTSELQSHMDI